MIRRKETKEFVIDIDGPEGNAFVLLGYARDFSRQIGLDSDEILSDMQSGDYYNLIKVFTKNFPFVIIETDQDDILEMFSE